MLCRIADITVDIITEYKGILDTLEPYRLKGEGKADFRIFADEERLKNLHAQKNSMTDEEIEQFCLADYFCRAAVYFGGVFLHSSAIEFEGKAYLFSAASQVGKSTHTGLWQKKFGEDRVVIINDDRPIIKMKDGVVTVYGSPFSGGSGKENNISAPLGAVFFLKRGEENTIKRLNTAEIIPRFIDNTIKYAGEGSLGALLDRLDVFIRSGAEFYELFCTPDERAVDCVYNTIKKGGAGIKAAVADAEDNK